MTVALLDSVRKAVRRAELRRDGVLPLMRRDAQREEIEDRLLAMVERARGERAARLDASQASARVVSLPVNDDGGTGGAGRRRKPTEVNAP